ncbi:winged helix-turn-helix transcriptional regulator [Micromonospora sp. PLK6-60]|uniref:winged helix-turn-helix transcriptional regulator n=1 Tax=Micromonospora sp. PLK6-60 TaxID=2873383 RepID=UPI001CA6AF57|nr:winged helix-turn-helix transcriptional regulator [Micromonospora sp. PLK6-60]MBY8875007.1 winged helix-turn-helix transcriptional regulator [Micromonospora sp. PLK6-60]
MNRPPDHDDTCGIAHGAAVIGDWWNLLVLREIARGNHRFDTLVDALHVSRKVLTQRLRHLTDHDVLTRRPYQHHPPRHEYLLTDRGRALLPTLIAIQDWADQWLLGDGALTATTTPDSPEATRVHALVGTHLPTDLRLTATDGTPTDPADGPTILFTYPGTGTPAPLPTGWTDIPGAPGCTLENRLFRDQWPTLHRAGITLHGVSTQRTDEQAAFAAAEAIPFPLLSDTELRLTAALRLPTFRAGQQQRLKRLILVIDTRRTITHALYPVTDIPAAVTDALRHATG